MSHFSIPLDQLAEKVNLDIETVTRKATLDMFNAVSLKAPVDTGRYRANMNVSYNAVDRTVTQSTDQGRMQSEIAKVATLPIGGIFYITNSLPYASVIEFGEYPNPPKYGSKKRGEAGIAVHVRNGYSMQAPQGVFRITAMEYSDYVKKAIAEK